MTKQQIELWIAALGQIAGIVDSMDLEELFGEKLYDSVCSTSLVFILEDVKFQVTQDIRSRRDGLIKRGK